MKFKVRENDSREEKYCILLNQLVEDYKDYNLSGHINAAKDIIRDQWEKWDDEFKSKDSHIQGHGFTIQVLCDILQHLTGIKFDPDEYELHHKDTNSTYNSIENLALAKTEEHLRLHNEVVKRAMGEFLDRHQEEYLRKSRRGYRKQVAKESDVWKSVFNPMMPPAHKEELARLYIDESAKEFSNVAFGECDYIDLYSVICVR